MPTSPTVVLALITIGVGLSGCSDGCKNTVVQSLSAPGGGHRAVLFQRDCGPTTGFGSQVSILKGDAQPGGRGNVFVSDDDHGAARDTAWHGPWVKMEWLSPSQLRISYDSKARVFARRAHVAGVTLTYDAVSEFP